VLHSAVLCCFVMCSAMLCCVVMRCVVLCCDALCCIVFYEKLLSTLLNIALIFSFIFIDRVFVELN